MNWLPTLCMSRVDASQNATFAAEYSPLGFENGSYRVSGCR